MNDDADGTAREGKEGDDQVARQKRAGAIHAMIDRLKVGNDGAADRPGRAPDPDVVPLADAALIEDNADTSPSTPARPDYRALTEPERPGKKP